MAKILLLGLLLCSVLTVFCEKEETIAETKFNPVSHTFQPIHSQPILRSPIRRQTIRLETVIRKPVQTKIIRGESTSVHNAPVIEPEPVDHVAPKPALVDEPEPVKKDPEHARKPEILNPVRSVEPAPVHELPQPAVQREYGSPEINDNDLQIERRHENRRTTPFRAPIDVTRDREIGLDRDQEITSNRELPWDREPRRQDREPGLEAALFSEPTTPGTPPELVVTTVSPTHPAYTTIDEAIRRGATSVDPNDRNRPIIDVEDDDDDEEEEEEEPELDPTEVENGINNRRRDESPIKTAIDYTKYKPRKRNLREKRLLRLLGDDYDPDWMSFELPKELKSVQPVGIAYKTDANLLTALNNLNFTFQSPNGLSFQPPPQLLNVFKDWLIRTAGCPVTFTWHDIGDYYWPRWVKRGECMNEAPCSWPPGQRCVPVRSHTVFILRWHCRRTLPRYLRRGRRFHVRGSGRSKARSSEDRGDRSERRGRKRNRERSGRRRSGRRDLPAANLQAESRPASPSLLTSRIKCRWLKIPYPVIANCFCTCP